MFLNSTMEPRLGAFFTEADVDATAPVCFLAKRWWTISSATRSHRQDNTRAQHSVQVVGVLQAKGFSATGQDQDDLL